MSVFQSSSDIQLCKSQFATAEWTMFSFVSFVMDSWSETYAYYTFFALIGYWFLWELRVSWRLIGILSKSIIFVSVLLRHVFIHFSYFSYLMTGGRWARSRIICIWKYFAVVWKNVLEAPCDLSLFWGGLQHVSDLWWPLHVLFDARCRECFLGYRISVLVSVEA